MEYPPFKIPSVNDTNTSRSGAPWSPLPTRSAQGRLNVMVALAKFGDQGPPTPFAVQTRIEPSPGQKRTNPTEDIQKHSDRLSETLANDLFYR